MPQQDARIQELATRSLELASIVVARYSDAMRLGETSLRIAESATLRLEGRTVETRETWAIEVTR